MPATARFSVPVCVLLFACDPANTDNDNDGYTADVDCNDADDTINPGVSQDLCDGVDADCDGLFDEDGLPTVIFADSDGDGFGNPFAPGFACTIPSGYVTNDDDCDDTDVNVNPDAKDICNLKNDDCDFFVDEDEPPIKVWHDRDEDGFGDDTMPAFSVCVVGTQQVTQAGDCDDTNKDINPDAKDVCNLINDDCDFFVDEDEPPTKVWHDKDQDGFGDDTQPAFFVCVPGTAQVTQAGDCDDTDANVNPDAKDICNLKNDDCDFFVDEDEPPIKVWHDRDEDGFGDDTMPAFSVCVVGTQQVTNDDDCDDTDANVNPDAKDICNLKNDDCDFFVDEDEPPTKVWHDRDEDGFGDRTKPAFSVCVPGSTQVTNDDDCDDTDANVNPDAKDVCNFIDDDCDAFIDEDEAPTKVWKDSDGDGFGCAGSAAVKVCAVSSGYVDNDQDCDDTDKDVNPDAVDICNFADDDCDRFIDEDESPYAVYKDGDSDGYGDRLDIGMKVCADTSGYVRDRTDCDDTRTGVYPGADELCGTSIDEDCDGSIDESDAIDALTWYYDGDLDGFGTADTTTLACDPPFRYADNADDCDDTDYMVSPAAFEICDNEIDDDCNELVDAADSEVCALSYCGVIETDTVWAAGEIIPVTCTVSVEDGATLTVEDGAVVEFSSGASLVIGVIDTSALVIEGDTDGVTFTSDQSTPASGDWGGVIVGANDLGSELDGLTIEYGGETGTECLLIDSVDLALTDVTVQLCGGDQGVRAALSSLTLNDLSVLDNDGDGLTLEENTTLTDGATLTASGNGGYPAVLTLETLGAFSTDSELTGNHDDRLKVPAGTLRESVSWSDPGIPFLFTGEVYVDAFGPATAVTLSIGAGVEAHFDTDAGLFIGYGGTGALTVAGTSTNPVIFTSAQDSPEAGDWLGIEFGVWDDGSTLEEVEISYGGGNTYGNLFFDGGSAASVSSATITNSSAYGIYRTSGVTPSLSTISYADNVSGDLF